MKTGQLSGSPTIRGTSSVVVVVAAARTAMGGIGDRR